MHIKFWGTRGSLPAPRTPRNTRQHVLQLMSLFFEMGFKEPRHFDEFLDNLAPEVLGGFGGNTSCTEVLAGDAQILIDGGTGIRLFSEAVTENPEVLKSKELHIFITHFHWDHLIGLPFLSLMYRKDITVNFYAVQPDLEANIRSIFKKPFFPVAFEQLGAKIKFHILRPRLPIKIKNLSITPYQLDHPDPCWGFKIEDGKKAYAHCVDTECLRTSIQDLGPDLPLYQNIDLMLFDAQYTLGDAVKKLYWGHAAAPLGLDIAMREGIKKVLFTHADPGATDQDILAAKAQTKYYYESQIDVSNRLKRNFYPVNWEFIYDEYTIEL